MSYDRPDYLKNPYLFSNAKMPSFFLKKEHVPVLFASKANLQH